MFKQNFLQIKKQIGVRAVPGWSVIGSHSRYTRGPGALRTQNWLQSSQQPAGQKMQRLRGSEPGVIEIQGSEVGWQANCSEALSISRITDIPHYQSWQKLIPWYNSSHHNCYMCSTVQSIIYIKSESFFQSNHHVMETPITHNLIPALLNSKCTPWFFLLILIFKSYVVGWLVVCWLCVQGNHYKW